MKVSTIFTMILKTVTSKEYIKYTIGFFTIMVIIYIGGLLLSGFSEPGFIYSNF